MTTIHRPPRAAYRSGIHRIANLEGVDPRLLEALQEAMRTFPLRVEFTPHGGNERGRRSRTSQHVKGRALDIVMYDYKGKPLSNYQNASTFRAYEKFAQHVRETQQRLYPDLPDDALRWGGYFGGRFGKYGAMDSMHFDLGGLEGRTMGAGSWKKGLEKGWEEAWGVNNAKQKGLVGTTTVPFADQQREIRAQQARLGLTPKSNLIAAMSPAGMANIARQPTSHTNALANVRQTGPLNTSSRLNLTNATGNASRNIPIGMEGLKGSAKVMPQRNLVEARQPLRVTQPNISDRVRAAQSGRVPITGTNATVNMQRQPTSNARMTEALRTIVGTAGKALPSKTLHSSASKPLTMTPYADPRAEALRSFPPTPKLNSPAPMMLSPSVPVTPKKVNTVSVGPSPKVSASDKAREAGRQKAAQPPRYDPLSSATMPIQVPKVSLPTVAAPVAPPIPAPTVKPVAAAPSPFSWEGIKAAASSAGEQAVRQAVNLYIGSGPVKLAEIAGMGGPAGFWKQFEKVSGSPVNVAAASYQAAKQFGAKQKANAPAPAPTAVPNIPVPSGRPRNLQGQFMSQQKVYEMLGYGGKGGGGYASSYNNWNSYSGGYGGAPYAGGSYGGWSGGPVAGGYHSKKSGY